MVADAYHHYILVELFWGMLNFKPLVWDQQSCVRSLRSQSAKLEHGSAGRWLPGPIILPSTRRQRPQARYRTEAEQMVSSRLRI